MSREIKFRAWNRVEKIMVYDNEDDSSYYWDGVINSDVGMVNHILNNTMFDEYEWMQYTGLKDKNSKEIYEGDVVRSSFMKDEPIIGIVKYSEKFARFYLSSKNKYGVGIAHTETSIWHYDYDNEDKCISEVIGNIYENPELIEKMGEL